MHTFCVYMAFLYAGIFQRIMVILSCESKYEARKEIAHERV